ncbi:hypothetical protein GCM10009555_015710 [Acrocarpospora macrocephala]|uniref:Uncharacterized protein n=1 Tax=Acrocarpospora macrocephala TaxID=150177 RepID=A0A5M3X6Q6_9ACTN|nr:hypothetical protein Amac_094270 [Acrocarpospora macrocephala]
MAWVGQPEVGVLQSEALVGAGPAEGGVVGAEDGLVDGAEFWAGFDAEFFDEEVAAALEDCQGFCLHAEAVEGDHQLAAEPFAGGVFTDQRAEFGHDLGFGVPGQIGGDSFLDG